MVAYAITFLIVGLPLGWAEWAMGRFAGQSGYSSCPAAYGLIARSRWAQLAGVIGVVIPIVVCMYYVVIEAWCLGYAVDFWLGGIHLKTPVETKKMFADFIGDAANGAACHWSWNRTLPWLVIVFGLNIVIIYRGLRGGIETVCNIAMPVLIGLALIVLVRVLTLGTPDATQPYDNVWNGLGYLWNPSKVMVIDQAGHTREVVGSDAVAAAKSDAAVSNGALHVLVISPWTQLRNPRLWLAAAGQIFFSLAVGFGIIIVYASYLKKNDDVVLSGLTASSCNEFCEVALGGLITVPAAVAFLGVASVAGQAGIGLGFKVLPLVFAKMPAGAFFGGAFFFMLFLAAITSSISMLQPGLVFFEETLGASRKICVALLTLITGLGSLFVLYFSADMKALDTLDFWGGTLLMFVLATVQTLIFGWVWGIDRGFYEMHRGAAMKVPNIFGIILKWISPAFLLCIFVLWVLQDICGYNFTTGTASTAYYVTDLIGAKANSTARLSVAIILGVGVAFSLLTLRSATLRRARQGLTRFEAPTTPP